MVFHAPYPLDPTSTRASRFRPVKMHDAFEALGYDVWAVTGYSRDRAAGMRRIRDALASGVKFDFCYSESSTMPMTMCDPRHLPTRPLLDAGFFRLLKRHRVPIGHFLRDIYWAFPGYREEVRPPKREAALAAYAWDLRNLRATLTRLYVPYRRMADYIDTGSLSIAELPPGHDIVDPAPGPSTGVRLLYVGDVGVFYRFERMVDAVSRAFKCGADVRLTICTREDSWLRSRDSYGPLLSDAITVVHAGGTALPGLYAQANVASLFVEPDEYWKISMPVKMFEYVGYGKPIFAAAESPSSDFVRAEDVGWTLPYDTETCVGLLVELSADPDRIAAARQRTLLAAARHTWLARARQVAEDLRGAR